MVLISVIVPVYKVEKYLKDCVDSILAQTFTDFELILVDDGSPDNCPQICDEFAEKDERVTVIHQKNKGLSGARNTGIELALKKESQWITFIDSDDWVEPDYLETLYNTAIQNNLSITACQHSVDDAYYISDGRKEHSCEFFSPENFWCSEVGNPVISCAKLYKKTLFESNRFPEGKIHEDEHTTYKLLFACKKIAFIKDVLYHYRKTDNSISRSEWSPAKISAVEAKREQVRFFKENGYPKAMKFSADSLIVLLRTYLDICKEKKFFGCALKLFFKLRIFALYYRFVIKAKIGENEWIYAKIHPRLIYFRSVLKKLFCKK